MRIVHRDQVKVIRIQTYDQYIMAWEYFKRQEEYKRLHSKGSSKLPIMGWYIATGNEPGSERVTNLQWLT